MHRWLGEFGDQRTISIWLSSLKCCQAFAQQAVSLSSSGVHWTIAHINQMTLVEWLPNTKRLGGRRGTKLCCMFLAGWRHEGARARRTRAKLGVRGDAPPCRIMFSKAPMACDLEGMSRDAGILGTCTAKQSIADANINSTRAYLHSPALEPIPFG